MALVPRSITLSMLALSSLLGVCQATGPTEDSVGFRGLDAASHTIAELRGHPAVVNFWATWCVPCRQEMPRLQALADRYATQGVTFIAISIDGPDGQKKIPNLIAKRKFRIPVWVGGTEDTFSLFGLDNIVPSTLILDEEGVVIGKIEGETREKDVTTRLDWLLGGRKGNRPKLVQKNDW